MSHTQPSEMRWRGFPPSSTPSSSPWETTAHGGTGRPPWKAASSVQPDSTSFPVLPGCHWLAVPFGSPEPQGAGATCRCWDRGGLDLPPPSARGQRMTAVVTWYLLQGKMPTQGPRSKTVSEAFARVTESGKNEAVLRLDHSPAH